MLNPPVFNLVTGTTRYFFLKEYCRRDWEEAELLGVYFNYGPAGQNPLNTLCSCFMENPWSTLRIPAKSV